MRSASSYPGRVSRRRAAGPGSWGRSHSQGSFELQGWTLDCRARQERTGVQVHAASSETRDLQHAVPLDFYYFMKRVSSLCPFSLFTHWLHWVFIVAHRFSPVVVKRGYSLVGVWVSHCGGIRLFQSTGSAAEEDCGLVVPQHVGSPWTRNWMQERASCIAKDSLPLNPQGSPIPLHFKQVSKLIVTLGNRCYKSPVKLMRKPISSLLSQII